VNGKFSVMHFEKILSIFKLFSTISTGYPYPRRILKLKNTEKCFYWLSFLWKNWKTIKLM